MTPKQFHRQLKTGKAVEVYHIVLKDTSSPDNDESCKESSNKLKFDDLISRHKNDTRLCKILKDNETVFKEEFPVGLPPQRVVNHLIEL